MVSEDGYLSHARHTLFPRRAAQGAPHVLSVRSALAPVFPDLKEDYIHTRTGLPYELRERFSLLMHRSKVYLMDPEHG